MTAEPVCKCSKGHGPCDATSTPKGSDRCRYCLLMHPSEHKTGRGLVGLTQIAERLDVPRSTVDSCRRRGKLPEPDLMIGIHPYWEWTNLELCGCSPCAQPSHPVCT